MKRSEMEQEILGFVLDRLLYSNTFNLADSKKLLAHMETLGMLPPANRRFRGPSDNEWEEE
jgi:hypothetical protein